MSSTNRGGERSADDHYQTPRWAVDALLRRVGPIDGKRILEPSAGTGRGIVARLLAAGATSILAIEMDAARASMIQTLPEAQALPDEHRPQVINDRFEAWAHAKQRFDLVVMNPPFTLAEEHIRLAISLLAPGGLCCALERLAFGCSRKRAPFRAAYRYDKFELACRPAFNGGGATDSADYAWFLFGTRTDGTPCGGRFEIIEEGPPR